MPESTERAGRGREPSREYRDFDGLASQRPSDMAKLFFLGSSLLLCLALFSAPPSIPSALGAAAAAAVVKDDVWVSPPSGVSCTMCLSCDNPCHPLPPPAVPTPTPPSSSYNVPPPPPPPSGSYYYPPPAGYSYPPPSVHYPGPPPPNPIMPYFPFYFYSPPPPSRTYSGSSQQLAAPFASSLQLLLLFLPLLFFF